MMRRLGGFAALTCIILMMAQSGHSADRMSVCVSIVPQKYFVQRIGGDRVDVQVMVKPGESPASYEPKPRQMAGLAETSIYFAIGVPFEEVWLERISSVNLHMKLVHTDDGIEKIPLESVHFHEVEEGHPETEEHHENTGAVAEMHSRHGGLDPHIWLSPPLVKRQAQTILMAFKRIDPENQSLYEANYHQFITEIDDLDRRLKAMLGGREGLRFMVFHPSWGYFAQAYGLRQIPIEIEGKDPKPAQLKALIEHARAEEIRVIFVQPQFSTKSAELIARGIDGRVAFADPLAEDWASNLLSVAENFKSSLK